MKLGGAGVAGRDFRSLFEGGSTAGLGDGQLLARFARGRGDAPAQAAFEALVARHGPMVWGTCRRILRDSHAAEDAFQATFLLLVRKAGSVRVDDSLGRWLHGVAVRVALRLRAVEGRRRGGDLSGVEAPGLVDDPDGLRGAIDEEVARLPAAYRSVVVLCHLEGLTRDRAADRLGCPVGTVNSRLSRAVDLLRTRLARRGLAPASGGLAAWLSTPEASAAVPPKLAGATASAAIRIAAGGTLAGMVPVGVAVLLQGTLRRMAMVSLMKATVLGATLMALAALAVGAGADGQEPSKGEATRAGAIPEVAKVAGTLRPPTPAERFEAILAEWTAADKACWAEVAKGATKAERNVLFGKFHPNELDYFRRCLDLADAAPKDPGARDAWLWVVTEGMRNDDGIGRRAVPIGKAVDGLLLHHADDPKVARAALRVANMTSPNRSTFTRGLHERAANRESKGVAALALAQYLQQEAMIIQWARSVPEQPNARCQTYDDEGRPKIIEGKKSYDDAYWARLKGGNEAAVRRESEGLYELVIAQYSDIPYSSWHYVDGRRVKNPHPKSLADFAQGKLDDLYNLAVGKPAPEIEGIDLDGNPLKLSDYKGKVVALVFWSSGCGPCLAAVPHERELLGRLGGRPFAILGVNTDEKPEAARKVVKDTNMTWASWQDGREGPIVDRYHIRSYPTTFVIDAKGIIRARKADGGGLDQVVEDLLVETEARPAEAK